MADWVTGKVVKVEFWTDALLFSLYMLPFTRLPPGNLPSWGWKSTANACSAPTPTLTPRQSRSRVLSGHRPGRQAQPAPGGLKPGDEVQIVSEAAGFFVLEEVPDCDTLWMLATGTAIGPYLSILQEGKDLERFKNLVLVHAARYAADLSYLPLMQELEKRYGGKLRIQTVVSRETVQDR
jgi:ferredoxin--NADP+ reductase